jgi:hypothetical protein
MSAQHCRAVFVVRRPGNAVCAMTPPTPCPAGALEVLPCV